MVDNVVDINAVKLHSARVMCRELINKFIGEYVGEELTRGNTLTITEDQVTSAIPMLPVLVGEAITAYGLFGSFAGRHEGDPKKAIRELVEMLVDAEEEFVEDVERMLKQVDEIDAEQNEAVKIHEFKSKEALKDFLDDVMDDNADS